MTCPSPNPSTDFFDPFLYHRRLRTRRRRSQDRRSLDRLEVPDASSASDRQSKPNRLKHRQVRFLQAQRALWLSAWAWV